MVARVRSKKTKNGHMNGHSKKKSWVERAADKAEKTSKDKKSRRYGDDDAVPEFDTPPGADEVEIVEPVPMIMPERRYSATVDVARTRHAKTEVLDHTYQPHYPKQVAEMVLNGATETDVIVALGITRTVFKMWCVKHAEFAAALRISSDLSLADERVKRSLYEMAVGYEMPAVKIVVAEGEVKAVPYTEQVAKNFNAAKHWLAQRDPKNWGKGADSPFDDAGVGSVINVKNLRGLTTDQLKEVLGVIRNIMQPAVELKRLDAAPVEAEVVDGDPKA